MRGVFIVAGVQLVRHFHAVLYVFAVFLLIMGVRLLREQGKQFDPTTQPGDSTGPQVVSRSRKIMTAGNSSRDAGGRLCATPLLLVLIMVEVADLTFAMDSIPAIFAVTQDAFIIFTSNVLAILGLRSLYFLLARAMYRFRYLHVLWPRF